MSRINLNDSRVNALKPRAKRYFVIDSITPGLLVQVMPSGVKSWMVRARYPNGNNRVRRRLALVGTVTVEQARTEARRWLGLLSQGLDPQRELSERKRQALAENSRTFSIVADAYIADRLRGQRQGARSAREIRSELSARWGERPLGSISRGDIVQLVDDLRERARRSVGGRMSGAHARCIFSHARALFRWACLRYDLPSSPCDRLRPQDLGLAPRVRQRVLNDDEIRALWQASEQLGYPFGSFIQTLLRTGCRRGEIANLKWSWVDLDNRLIVIPAEQVKSGSEHRIPITADLATLLAGLPRYRSGDLVFATNCGRKPIGGFSKRTARLHRLMRAELGEAMPSFCLHDLRRTMRTRLSEIGIAEHIAEIAIGHAKRGLIRIYDQHRHQDEVREAFVRWHKRLRDLVAPPPANVVALHA